MKTKFLKYVFGGIVLIALIFVVPAHAAQLPEGEPITLGDITDLITLVVRTLLGMGGIVAAGFIVWAGITWMAAGGDDTKVKDAKARLKAGIWGAVIVFGVFVILATIESVLTGEFFFR